MAFDVTILHGATIEVTEILDWYNEQNDFSAGEFHNDYLSSIEKLKANPQFYSYIHKQFRRLLMEKFPYKIIYEITGNKVIIYRVSHTSRDDRNWFKQA
jgi:plasmid stabilization system protein ParE